MYSSLKDFKIRPSRSTDFDDLGMATSSETCSLSFGVGRGIPAHSVVVDVWNVNNVSVAGDCTTFTDCFSAEMIAKMASCPSCCSPIVNMSGRKDFMAERSLRDDIGVALRSQCRNTKFRVSLRRVASWLEGAGVPKVETSCTKRLE